MEAQESGMLFLTGARSAVEELYDVPAPVVRIHTDTLLPATDLGVAMVQYVGGDLLPALRSNATNLQLLVHFVKGIFRSALILLDFYSY